MGITLYLKGRFKEAKLLPQFVNHAIDFAESQSWQYLLLEKNFPHDAFTCQDITPHLYGIIINIPKVEPLMLSFLSTGEFCNLMAFNEWQDGMAHTPELKDVFCKTQYSDYLTHKKIVDFIKDLAPKYFENFECIDDTNYYKNEDIDELKDSFDRHQSLIDGFSNFLSDGTQTDDEGLNRQFIEAADEIHQAMNDLNDEDEPDLSLEDQINYKKMKLAIENEGVQFRSNKELPPEIENKFLDYVMAFEEAFKKNEHLTLHELLGFPDLPKYDDLKANEIEDQINYLSNLLNEKQVRVNFIYDYDNEDELFYRLVTEKLLDEEILNIKDIFNNFIYEEFYPNDYEDIKRYVFEFFEDFFREVPSYFNASEIKNIKEIKNFRQLFSQLKCHTLEILTQDYGDSFGEVVVDLTFDGLIENTNEKMTYTGLCHIKIEKKYDFWHLVEVQLPV